MRKKKVDKANKSAVPKASKKPNAKIGLNKIFNQDNHSIKGNLRK